MIIRLIILFFLIFLNGFFVASEAALISVRKTHIEDLVRKGVKRAKLVKKALENLNLYISTTQIGSTIASIAIGWVGEPIIHNYLELLFGINISNTNTIAKGIFIATISVVFITIFHLIFGELAPKTAALREPEKHSLFLITPLFIFTKILSPVSQSLNYLVHILLKMAGFKSQPFIQKPYSEQEIKMILSYGHKDGAISQSEIKLINHIFELKHLRGNQIKNTRTTFIKQLDKIIVDIISRKKNKR